MGNVARQCVNIFSQRSQNSHHFGDLIGGLVWELGWFLKNSKHSINVKAKQWKN
jgi:hypothetical protein